MKITWKNLFLVLTAACALSGLAACNTSEEQPKHEHTPSAYSWDETSHKQKCDECNETLTEGWHVFTDGVCVCGYALVDDQGLVYEYDVSTESYTVTRLQKPSATMIVIPEAWMNRPVTKIGEFAFSQSELVKVSIPASITEIGDNAFAVKNAVTSVNIFDLKAWFNISFGDAFANPMCNGGDLILNDGRVTDLTVPAGVTQVKDYVFAGCESVKQLTVPEGVTSIGDSAFYQCENLETISLPASLKSAASTAFGQCGKIASIEVAAGNAYYRVDNNCLIETATGTLVRGCANGAVPAGVTNIGDYAFSGCEALTSFTVPETVTEIGSYAFSGTGLSAIKIPASVTELKHAAFLSCDLLVDVQLTAGIVTIGSAAFAYCGKLTNIALPETLKTIGWCAFEHTGLTEITIPDGVEEIGEEGFVDCTALTKVTIGNGLKNIGNSAFEGCERLAGVYISDLAAWCGILFDGNRYSNPLWFAHNLYLNGAPVTELTVPASIKEIPVRAFGNCTSITSVVIESGVTKILGAAFEQCANLQTVTIAASVTAIGITAFANCAKLEHIYFEGTRAQWDEIEKDVNWDGGSKAYTLYCSGDIS